tara:strand:- start:2975 stop:3286 length:312 start_codon:yes stop_codon:yes gene_type:complete
MSNYRWRLTGFGDAEIMEGDFLFARVINGGTNISSSDAGISVLWGVYSSANGGGLTDCRARGEVTFTSFRTVKDERKMAKRLAKSTLLAMEQPIFLEDGNDDT